MSKVQFRARALEASKPMPIYMAEELPDLTDYSAINRAVPQMPSGMEKEEECEHHLQRAICTGLIIPTPEVANMADAEAYDKIYPGNYKQPKQLIHMQPFNMEQEIPDYDMDSEDEVWVNEQARRMDLTPLKFESMMDRLEKSSGQTVVTLHDAKALLKEDDDLIIAIFDYWLNKRLKTQHPLILAVKTEHRVGGAANNPYLAFRRRTEKMQTRKIRKNDETSYEKMLKLRRDLSRAVTLLEMVKRREKTKREHLHLTIEIVEKRYQAQDFSGALLSEVSALRAARPAFAPLFTNQFTNQNWTNKVAIKDEIIPRKEKRQYKKRKHKSTSSHTSRNILSASGLESVVSSDEDDVSNPMLASPDEPDTPEVDDGKFAFRRNKHCSYHMPLTNRLGNWPWCSREENGSADNRYRFTLTSIRHPKPRCIGFARRRLGRGGRVILDRISTPYDDLWRDMDFTIMETPSLAERLALKKILNEDSNKPSEDVEMLSESVNKTIVERNKTIALRNLYSEHNYNSTNPLGAPSGCSPLMDVFNTCSDTTSTSPSQTLDIKSEGDAVYVNSDTQMEQQPSTSDVVMRVKEEVWTWTDEKVVKSEPSDDVVQQNCGISDVHNIDTNNDRIVNNNNSYQINSVDKDVLLADDDDDSTGILLEIKQQWQHFRPKTPPSDYEPVCNLLPAKEDIFNPSDYTQISVEIENLSSSPPSTLCDPSTFTSEFTLNDIYTELNLDYQIQQEELETTAASLMMNQEFSDNNSSPDDISLLLNDIQSSNVTSTCPSETHSSYHSDCSCSTNNYTIDNFGCSRVSVTSNSDIRTLTNNLFDNQKHLCSTSTATPLPPNCNSSLIVTSPPPVPVPVPTLPVKTNNIQLVQHSGSNNTNTQQQRNIVQHVQRTQSILSNTLISPNKYSNSVVVNSGERTGLTTTQTSASQVSTLLFDRVTGNVTTLSSQGGNVRMIGTLTTSNLGRSSSQEHTHANGPVTSSHVDAASMALKLNCKPANAEDMSGDNNSPRVHLLQNNSSSINSQVRRAILNSQSINTLNSNSVNLMDSTTLTSSHQLLPSEATLINSNNDTTNVKMKSIHHIKQTDNSIAQQTTTTSSGGGNTTSTNNTKQQIVRKNNTLAMEVT